MLVKKQLPALVTFFAGASIIAGYFLNVPSLGRTAKDLVNWNVIVEAFALAVGMGNLFAVHGKKIARRDQDSAFSIVLLASMVAWFALGVSKGIGSGAYRFLWDSLLLPAQATMYSTTIFFITSAAYRAFRVKNAYAAVLLVSALLVMGRVGVGAVIWPGFQTVSSWIMRVPNTAGMRAITIGGAMSMVGNSVRIILGLERGYLGGLGE